MHKQIRKQKVCTIFAISEQIWLFHRKISNGKPIQLSIIANIFDKVYEIPQLKIENWYINRYR